MDDPDKLISDGLFALWIAYAAHWFYDLNSQFQAWLTPQVSDALEWLRGRLSRRGKVLQMTGVAVGRGVAYGSLSISRPPPDDWVFWE